MWKAKDKFGKIVRSNMSNKELEKFISKNKGYTFEDHSVNSEFNILISLVVLSLIALIIIWL